MRVSQRAFAATVWLAAVGLLGVGYVRIEVRDAAHLASVESDARILEAKIARAESIVHNRLALRAARRRIVSDIRAEAMYGSRSDLGPMLRSLDRATRRAGIALISIEPKNAEPVPAKDRWLRARRLHMTLRGTFARLMTFLPALSEDDPLVRLRAIQISSNDSGGTMRPLVFGIDADAYDLADPNAKE